MANEALIQSSLKVVKGNINYQSLPANFNADVTGQFGPGPGTVVAVITTGTDLVFTGFTQPSLCWIKNLDTVNFVEIGIWDATTFHPLIELLPGEAYPIRLSRNITTVRLKADTASVSVQVDAFEV